jgi:hypothetical protein
MWLLQICSEVAAILPQFCREYAASLLDIYHNVVGTLPRVCCKFAVSLLDFYRNFAATLLRDSCELSTCLQLICCVFAANLPRVCCKFTASLLQIYREFATIFAVKIVLQNSQKKSQQTCSKRHSALPRHFPASLPRVCRDQETFYREFAATRKHFTASLPRPGNILSRHCHCQGQANNVRILYGSNEYDNKRG